MGPAVLGEREGLSELLGVPAAAQEACWSGRRELLLAPEAALV